MTEKTDDLPGVIEEIAEVAGRQAAIRLAMRLGGSVIHVPRPSHVSPDHPLAEAIGIDAARAVAERFAGEGLYIPMSRRFVARHLSDEGLAARQIASQLGVSIRTVQRYRSTVR